MVYHLTMKFEIYLDVLFLWMREDKQHETKAVQMKTKTQQIVYAIAIPSC